MVIRNSPPTVTGAVETHAGISANLGKTRVFNYAGGPTPPGIADLGPWRASRPPQQHGFVALGTPIYARQSTSALSAPKDSKPKTRCSASCLSCLTCSARGSSAASAPHPALATCSGPSLPTSTRHMPPHMTQPYGARFRLLWVRAMPR